MNIGNLKRLLCGAAISTVFCIFASAQNKPQVQTAAPPSHITADENFELNIVDERIAESNFERSTSVELKDESRGNLRVEAGAGVRAEQINVFLRGITGRVTFRASLEPILKRIERLKTPVAGSAP